MITPNTSFTTDTPYTYLYVMHLTFCGRIFKHKYWKKCIMEKEHQNKTHSHLFGIVSQLNEFHTIIPKISPHTIHTIYVQECASLLPKEISNNIIFLFHECDTFDRTTIGSTWLAGVTSQDHPNYTQLIWSSSIKMHFIDLQ